MEGQTYIQVGYKDLYPDKKTSIIEVLSKINRNIAIKLVHCMIENEEGYMTYDNIVSNLFGPNGNSILSELEPRIRNFEAKSSSSIAKGKITFFTAHAGLELLKYLFSMPLNEHIINQKAEYSEQLFYAILLVNDELNKYTTPLKLGDFNTHFAEISISIALSYSDFVPVYDNLIILATFSYKIQKLFEFCNLPKNEKTYKILFEEYLHKYNCKSVADYVKQLYILFASFQMIPTLDSNSNNSKEYLALIENISISIDSVLDFKENSDYKIFRDKPIIKLGNNYICISKIFLTEKLFNSFIFDFKSITETNKTGPKLDSIFSDFALNFSEEHLFTDLMTKIYLNRKYKKLSSQQCRAISANNEPDYYARNGKYIFLYEYKDIMIRGDFKQIKNSIEAIDYWIEEHFVSKVTKSKDKTKIKESAIKQLATRIEAIHNNNFPWDTAIPKNPVIYPVLVVSREIFTIRGFAYLLNKKLQTELKDRGIDTTCVKDLLLIDQDTLILFSEEFSNKRLCLRSLAENYYTAIKRKPTSSTMTATSRYLASFSEYLKSTLNPQKHSLMKFIEKFR